LGPGDERTVTRDLIVLRGLAGGHEAGVPNGVIIDLVDDLLAFRDDPEDGIALPSFGLLLHEPEYLLQALHVHFGFVEVIGERLGELRTRAVLGKLGKRLEELLLGVIQVLKLSVE
jgi:hypothetical protein